MMPGRTSRQVGILGGTFNPVHLVHLLIAQDAFEQAGLDVVRFIPAADPPHKDSAHVAAATHRIEMLRLAIDGDPRFEIDDLELQRGGRSYSIDTIRALQQMHPDENYHFIIGSDSLVELDTWKDVAELVKLCGFITLLRPGVAVPATPTLPGIVNRIVTGHLCDVSSTDIRDRVRRNQSIRYLVPDPVFHYIHQQKLYR